jgi:hypothetical protein
MSKAPIGCVLCHTLPTGLGPDMHFVVNHWEQIPPGTNSDHHLAVVAIPRSDYLPFKIPQLRNLFDKTGMDLNSHQQPLGFWFFPRRQRRFVGPLCPGFVPIYKRSANGGFGGLSVFVDRLRPPAGNLTDPNNAPGVASQDTPAATGLQLTLSNSAPVPLLDTMLGLATNPGSRLDLVVKGRENGLPRGWFFEWMNGFFQSDRLAETETPAQLLALAAPGSEQTYTLVPMGSGERIGIDRDADGYFDQDELDAGSNPADPLSVPTGRPRKSASSCRLWPPTALRSNGLPCLGWIARYNIRTALWIPPG